MSLTVPVSEETISVYPVFQERRRWAVGMF